MEPVLIIILSCVGVLAVVLAILAILSISKKNKKTKIIKGYYNEILEAVGGIKNVKEVSNMGSRLSFVLVDMSKINQEKLNAININGIVKTTTKVTLVVGEMASSYKEEIEKLLKK